MKCYSRAIQKGFGFPLAIYLVLLMLRPKGSQLCRQCFSLLQQKEGMVSRCMAQRSLWWTGEDAAFCLSNFSSRREGYTCSSTPGYGLQAESSSV